MPMHHRMALPTTDAFVRHLLRRSTYGLTPILVRAASASPSTWLEGQLRPWTIRDTACNAVVARFPTLKYSIPTVRAKVEAGQLGSWDAMIDLGTVAIARAAWSQRQLQEVLVDVWSNLLQITCPSSDVWDNRARYDADVIRKYVVSRYTDLLAAAITHPAMLTYLNNASSTKTDPNENLGRELLELHSVGVEAGFTERDVRQSALILTGLSTDYRTGAFRYRPDAHYVGGVRVLGFTHPNSQADGRAAVQAYLRYLATRPATARRVCRRLAVRFVADEPPRALLDRMVRVYLSSGTQIIPVLRTLFSSKEFAASVDAKVRTPYESLVASIRALDMRPPATGTRPLLEMYWAAASVGQQPYAWPQPDGYPDVATAWQSAAGTLARWNMNSSLAGNWWPRGYSRRSLATFVPRPRPATHGALIDVLGMRVRQRSVTPTERGAICTFLGVRTTTPLRADSPALTWRLEHVVALLLNSPIQARR
jgi:uncharacterized protein (DUF1800 family)